MSSNSRPIIILSDVEVEDAMSSTLPVIAPVQSPSPIVAPVNPAPLVPSLALSNDTEAFYEDEVTPTPQISPSAPPLVTCAPTESLSHTTPVPSEPTPIFHRTKTTWVAKKRVHFVATTSRVPTTPTPSSPPVLPTSVPTSTSCLPPKKRARSTPSISPATESTPTPPPAHYHIGESSRTAAARAPTPFSLDAQLTELQGQMIRLQYQVRETMEYRLDVVEEGVEDLVQGRVGIEVSYHGLEERQFKHQGLIESLRDELPEIRNRAETTQNAQQGQAQELLLVQERLTALESRETARQAHVERLEGIIARMSRQIRRLEGAPGDA